MQSNSITLSVDLANDGNPTDQVFTRFEELVNRSTYVGPGHSLASPHTMQLYRTLPKRTGTFLGAAKSSIKFTKTIIVDDADGNETKKPIIGEASFSIPVGASAAETLALRQHFVSALDNALAAALNDTLSI
jgi:hypothetical protein